MGEIKINDRDIIVPGEILAEGLEYIPSFGTAREGENIVASMIGLASIKGKIIKLIPLAGRYIPKGGDTIIGRVQEILFSGWMLDTNCAYHAMLSMKEATSEFIERGADLTQYYNLGDYVVTKIVAVTSQKLIDVTMKSQGLRKLKGGQIINVNYTKVPRIIGKKGSMIELIKNATRCKIVVGQNGLIWLEGEPEMEIIAVKTIRMIEENSHTNGLTDKVKDYLEGLVKKNKESEQAN